MELTDITISPFELNDNMYDTEAITIPAINYYFYTNNIDNTRENNINNNKKLLLNVIIGISFIMSITYIIYIHNETIYNNLKQIKKITDLF